MAKKKYLRLDHINLEVVKIFIREFKYLYLISNKLI